jgi:hypothetical protein
LRLKNQKADGLGDMELYICSTVEKQTNYNQIMKTFSRYGIEPYVTAKWDHMQHYLHCCGGNNYRIGYKDYRVTPIGQNFSVPDSCCFDYAEGCGRHLFHKSDVEIANIIFVHGCLQLLKDQV